MITEISCNECNQITRLYKRVPLDVTLYCNYCKSRNVESYRLTV